MIRIGRELGNGYCDGEVVCHNCAATAPIVLWQVEPALNYAMPADWTRIQMKGNLYGQLCPGCTATHQDGQPCNAKTISS